MDYRSCAWRNTWTLAVHSLYVWTWNMLFIYINLSYKIKFRKYIFPLHMTLKRNFCRPIWTVCTTCAISLLPGFMKVTKTRTVEREYSKTTKILQKFKTKRLRKVPFPAQYTKIIKRFRTVAFTDLDQWQFVIKLWGNLSSSSLICVQSRKKHWPRCVNISCQKISAIRTSPEGWP